MYTLEVTDREGYNNATNEFINVKQCTLRLEHSLIAISKWESKTHRRFLDGEVKNLEDIRFYAECMCIEKNVDPNLWKLLTVNELKAIVEYTEDPMTGTTFGPDNNQNNNEEPEKMSSELIYFYMAANKIPFSCEKWNLNRLLTLLKICGIKNQVNDKPKASQSQLLDKYASMHAAKKRAKK